MKRNKKEIKNKETGKLLIISGCILFIISFIFSGENKFKFLQTNIKEGNDYPLGSIVGWETLMTITLSITIIFAGIIFFFAFDKIFKKK